MAPRVSIMTPFPTASQNRVVSLPIGVDNERRDKVANNLATSPRVFYGIFRPGNLQPLFSRCFLFLISQCLSLIWITAALGQEVTVLGVEITQSIQALNVANASVNNSVPLIKNKSTLVRVYFDVSANYGSTSRFLGSLYVARTSGANVIGVILPSTLVPIQADPGVYERQSLTARLDFIIPKEVLGGDGLLVGPLQLFPYPATITTPMHPNPTAPACNGCGFTITKRFRDTATLRVRLIGVEYIVNGERHNTLPHPDIAHRVYSWLSRAYPVDPYALSVEYVQPMFSFDVNTMLTFPPPTYHQADCNTTNYFIRSMVRELEVNGDPTTNLDDLHPNHPLRHTHYIGVVYDGTDLSNPPFAPLFKSGCSDQGLTENQLPPASLEHFFMKVGSVPSGPIGPPSSHPWYQKPPWYGDMGAGNQTNGYWDDDGEYADWYVGHELGHLLGLEHIDNQEVDPNPQVCQPVADDPPNGYPYPNGQLSHDDTYAGFDSKGEHFLTMRSLPGKSWHDIMSYCVRPWLSAETYRHIQCRINRENNLPCDELGFAAFFSRLYQEVGLIRIPEPDPPPHTPSKFDFGRDKLITKFKSPSKIAATPSTPQATADSKPTPHLNVLSSINWKERKGNLQFVTVISDAGTPTGKKDNRVKIRLTNSDKTTEDFPITSPTNTGVLLDTSALQWVEAVVPFKPRDAEPRTVKVELVIEENPVDSLEVGTATPSIGEIVLEAKDTDTSRHLKPDPKSRRNLVFSWGSHPALDEKVKIVFSVLISLDGGLTWQAAALLSEPQFEIPSERLMGAQSVMLRVTASDGFNSKTVTSPNLAIPPPERVRSEPIQPRGDTSNPGPMP